VPEVGDDPDERAPPVSERRGERRGRQAAWGTGPGRESRLGHTERGKRKARPPGWTVRVGEGKEKGHVGPGCKEKKRGEKKRASGPGPIRKRGRKRIAFECSLI
jgi:hypothetical protein